MIKAIRDGREVYHWPASLKQLIKLKKKHGAVEDLEDIYNYDPNEYEEALKGAIRGAEDWQMCACGSLCQAIPRNERQFGSTWGFNDPLDGRDAPKDKPLARLGLKFMKNVQEQDFEKALETMEKIEERATTILQKMGLVKKTYGKPLK